MCLVALALEPTKKTTNPRPPLPRLPLASPRFAIKQPGVLFGRHVPQRNIGPDPRSPRTFQHPLLHLTVGRRPPGYYCPLAQGQKGIRNDLLKIEFDDTAEAFALSACANRAIG